MAVTSAGCPSIGISRGHVSVGRRSSPGRRNGRRYSSISASLIVRSTLPGSTRSTKTFLSSTIGSPASVRKASKTGRADSGHSSIVTGRTIASM